MDLRKSDTENFELIIILESILGFDCLKLIFLGFRVFSYYLNTIFSSILNNI